VVKSTPELVVAFSLDPGHFDPRVEAGVPGFSMMYPHMYETIIWRRKDIPLDPALSLAEKWEQVDPTTLRLTLRQGVKFHNGDGFDAEAVKVSAESYTAPESKFPVKSSAFRPCCRHARCASWGPGLLPIPWARVRTSLSNMSQASTC
jgi:ABC-type transport system substrate-binding protein